MNFLARGFEEAQKESLFFDVTERIMKERKAKRRKLN